MIGVPDRVALVSGAASGHGAAVGRMLAAEGFSVGLMDIDERGLARTVEQIEARNGRAVALVADVSDYQAVERAVRQLESACGTVWLAAAAAAVLEVSPILEAPPRHWDRVTANNYLGVINVNTAAARSMVDNGRGGRVINWSSIAACRGVPEGAAYVGAKAAVEAFSRTLAIELAPYQITVNVLRPGAVDTPMMAGYDARARDEEAQRIPLGRWGTPEDILGAVRFLAGPDAAWVTGSIITIDGGTRRLAARRRSTPGNISSASARRRAKARCKTQAAGRPLARTESRPDGGRTATDSPRVLKRASEGGNAHRRELLRAGRISISFEPRQIA